MPAAAIIQAPSGACPPIGVGVPPFPVACGRGVEPAECVHLQIAQDKFDGAPVDAMAKRPHETARGDRGQPRHPHQTALVRHGGIGGRGLHQEQAGIRQDQRAALQHDIGAAADDPHPAPVDQDFTRARQPGPALSRPQQADSSPARFKLATGNPSVGQFQPVPERRGPHDRQGIGDRQGEVGLPETEPLVAHGQAAHGPFREILHAPLAAVQQGGCQEKIIREPERAHIPHAVLIGSRRVRAGPR